MQVLIMAAFVVTLSLAGGGGEPGWALPPAGVAGAVAAYLAIVLAATWAAARLGLRRMMRSADLGPSKPVRMLGSATRGFMVAGSAALVELGLGRAVDVDLHLAGIPLAGELVTLAPFMAALVIYWHTVYPLESASRDRMLAQAALAGQPVLAAWSRRDYLSFNIRCNLLFVLAPVALIMLALGVLGRLSRWAPDSAVMAAGVAATLGVFLVTPTIMVWLWGTRPLPESPLRSSLEAFCRRVGLTYRRIVLWPTGGAVVNAGVMGLVRPMRYVLLSDGLLAGMSQPAVEAVFAHEAGHVVHKHILYLMLFSIGTLTLLTTALEEVLKLARIELTMRWELAVALVAASGWLFLFGLISRRFERQADVFAACSIRLRRTPGCAATADTCSTAAPGCADNSSPFQGEGGPQGRVRVGPGPTADTCSTAALGCAPPVDPANPAEGGWATSSSPRLTLEGVTQFSSALEQVALLNGHFLTQWNFRHGSILSRIDHLHRLLHADSALTRYNRWSLALRFAILTLFAAGLACTLLSYAGW